MKFLTVLALPSLAFAAAINAAAAADGNCSCQGAAPALAGGGDYLCEDRRLGPKQLPTKLPLGGLVAGYSRFGGDNVTVAEFLAAWTGPDGRYRYPPQNGFALDVHGHGINGTMRLEVGTLIDRFGGESGSYVAAATAPFSQRSLPPASLDTDPSDPGFPHGYHLYRVVRALDVVGGPIAPWFGQPGLGSQFWTGRVGNVKKLLADGYIERQDPSVLVTQSQGACA